MTNLSAMYDQHFLCVVEPSDRDLCTRLRVQAEGARNEEMGRQLPTVLLKPRVKEDSPHDALNM